MKKQVGEGESREEGSHLIEGGEEEEEEEGGDDLVVQEMKGKEEEAIKDEREMMDVDEAHQKEKRKRKRTLKGRTKESREEEELEKEETTVEGEDEEQKGDEGDGGEPAKKKCLDPDKGLKLNQEVELEKRRQAEREHQSAALLLSWLLVLAMPIVVWRCISDPLLTVWRLSLLLCVCSCIWSRLLDAAMSSWTMLLFFSSSFLLALYADAALDAKIGVLIAHLSSQFAAGMLGYALAEHRQRNGTKVSATITAVGNPTKEKAAHRLRCFQMLGALYFTLVTLGFAARMAWVVWHRADYPTEVLLGHVFLPLALIIMFWASYVAGMLLQGALVGETGLCLLVLYLVYVMVLFTVALIVVGETGAIIFMLHGFLGLSGFFGYSLSVYSSFKLRYKLMLSNFVAFLFNLTASLQQLLDRYKPV